ncbi:MAG: nucleotide exchange factor GrpE [Bacteroidota bacterium]
MSEEIKNGQEATAPEEQVVENQETKQEAPSAEKQLEDMQQKYSELNDKFLRLFAEFDNYKKRTLKEKIDLMKTAAQDTVAALLPVLDDFDRAKKYAEDDTSTEAFSEGVQSVYHKLHGTLAKLGLEAMETEQADFDPELHEALTEIPAPTPELKGKIVDTIDRGYLLKGKIIRHAKVVVGK